MKVIMRPNPGIWWGKNLQHCLWYWDQSPGFVARWHEFELYIKVWRIRFLIVEPFTWKKLRRSNA